YQPGRDGDEDVHECDAGGRDAERHAAEDGEPRENRDAIRHQATKKQRTRDEREGPLWIGATHGGSAQEKLGAAVQEDGHQDEDDGSSGHEALLRDQGKYSRTRRMPFRRGDLWWEAPVRTSTSSRFVTYQSYDSMNISSFDFLGVQPSCALALERSKNISR